MCTITVCPLKLGGGGTGGMKTLRGRAGSIAESAGLLMACSTTGTHDEEFGTTSGAGACGEQAPLMSITRLECSTVRIRSIRCIRTKVGIRWQRRPEPVICVLVAAGPEAFRAVGG